MQVDDSPPSQTAPDSLSARSYFEIANETLHPEEQEPLPSPEESVPGTPAGTKGDSGPRLRPRKGHARSSTSEKTEAAQPDPHSQDRPRKRGRPRITTAKDAAAIEERRLQIRRAQRTYRQKKETTIQSLRSRVDILEQTLQNVSAILAPGDADAVAYPASLSAERIAQARRLILAEINKDQSNDSHPQIQATDSSTESLRDVFGYHASNWGFDEPVEAIGLSRNHARSPSPLLNRLFPTNTIYTYSNQESNLSRRLHRFCIEHIYRWLSDSRSDPAMMSRVFGLLPCIQDMPGVRRQLRRALQSEIGGPLELVKKLPYYTLGGAGTHFPSFGPDGMPVYPENLRRPSKILRRLARILRRGGIQDWDEDWSGNAEPDAGDGLEIAEKLISREDRLRNLGLEGDWFDCHDVQGYLEQQGFLLDGSSVWVGVPAMTAESLCGFTSDGSASQLYFSPYETSPAETEGFQYLNQPSYVLDVECFFDQLLANVRFLGRAPGFRLWDVDAALRAAIQRNSFT